MSAESNDLLIRICRAARVLLDRIRQEAQGALAALDPDPGAPPPFAGRLLGRLRPPDVTDPAAAALVRAVTAALPTGPSPDGAELRLVGLVSPDGTGRGPALLAVGPGAPGPMLALGATDAGIELLAAGTGGAPVVVPLGRGLELELTVGAAANADVLFPPGGHPPRILAGDAAAQIRWHLRRVPGAPALTLGPQAGPHALVGDLGLDVSMTGSAVAVRLTLPNLTVSVAPDIVTAVLGDAVRVRADVLLTANPEGIGLGAGQGMRAQLPARVDVPVADVDAVQLALSPRPAADATAGLTVAVIVGFRLSLAPPMLPLRFAADGLGVTFPLALGDGTGPGVGLDSGAVVPAEASGLNAGLRLPPVSGSGYLAALGDGSYAGVLDLDLGFIAVQAYGLLKVGPDAQLSFVAIISVRFPYPGIQLGYGFSLNAVGGLVAVNRRIDQPALRQAVLDGSADALLFPPDPMHNAPAIVQTLARVFPQAPGHAVAGPMLQLGWGGRLFTASVAVLLEAGPGAQHITILGRVVLALPDPAVPVVLMQATVLGVIDPTVPEVSVLATVHGSHLAGIAITGDMFVLVRGGAAPVFVLSVGGFHPRYTRPAGVPALRRVGFDLCPLPVPRLRAEAYLAVTTNTVQLGASIELSARIAGCGIAGWFAFDAIVAWDPVFAFQAHATAGVAVKVAGETLLGINLELLLEGPAPWHAHGTGTVELLFFDISIGFDESWGGDLDRSLERPPDVEEALREAFADPRAWTGEPPADDRSRITYAPGVAELLRDGHVVHPLGSLTARQRAVPLGLRIDQLQNRHVPPQTWQVTAAALADAQPASIDQPVRDEFAPGVFLRLTDDDRVGRPSYEWFDSGVHLEAAERPGGQRSTAPVETDWDTRVVNRRGEPPVSLKDLGGGYVDPDGENLLQLRDIHGRRDLWAGLGGVAVRPSQPLAVVTADTLAARPSPTGAGYSVLRQVVADQRGLQVAQRWEVAR